MPAWQSSSARASVALRAATTILGLALILWSSVPADAFRGGGGFHRGGGFQRGSSFRGGGGVRRGGGSSRHVSRNTRHVSRTTPHGRTANRSHAASRSRSYHDATMNPRATAPRNPPNVSGVHGGGSRLPPRVTARLPIGPRVPLGPGVQIFGDQYMPDPTPAPSPQPPPPPANDPPPDPNPLSLLVPQLQQFEPQPYVPPPVGPLRQPDPAGCQQAQSMLDTIREAQDDVSTQIFNMRNSGKYTSAQADVAVAPLQAMLVAYASNQQTWLAKLRAACGY